MSTNDPYTTPQPDQYEFRYVGEVDSTGQSTGPHLHYTYPPQPQPTSGMAVASMVLGIVGVTIGWFMLGIPAFLAIIFGHIALGEVKKGKAGRGMAVAGLVLGYIVGAIVVIGIIAVAYGD